jgi:hypothetical protein
MRLKILDVTTLKILARMARGDEGPNVRFNFVSPTSKEVLCSCSTLEELYECVMELDSEIIHKHVCLYEEKDKFSETKDLAFYIHYVFGDAELSMKIHNIAERFVSKPEKLKLELGNLLFTRLLNFSEISLIPD